MPRNYQEYEIPYQHIRKILRTEYANASPEEIESLVALTFGEAAAGDLENYLEAAEEFPEIWGWIKRTAKKAGRWVKKGIKKVVPLATTAVGAFLGGPIGAKVGGAAGGILNKLLRGKKRARRNRYARRTRRRARRRRTARSRVATPSGAVLAKLLERPELRKSLMSMLLGNKGREFIPIGEQQVPVTAILETVSELAQQSIAEYNAAMVGETSGSIPNYLHDDRGEMLIDPTDATQRAELVMTYFEIAEMDEDNEMAARQQQGRYREEAPVTVEYDDSYLPEAVDDAEFWEGAEEDDFDDAIYFDVDDEYEIDDEIFEYDEEGG